jgi:hypothetical protein
MKKAWLTAFITAAAAASALAQGSVVFENALSSGWITIGPDTGPASYVAAGTYTTALLWAPGTTSVPQNDLTQITIYGLATGGITDSGFFLDSPEVYVLPATAGGTPAIFEVQAWPGNYTSYGAALGAGAYVGQTAEFVNGTGNHSARPPGAPANLSGWDGNLILVPEPGTLALGGLGAAALLFFRKRKNLNAASN